MDINQIKSFLGDSWHSVGRYIEKALDSDIGLLNQTNSSILSNSGKQMRPMLSLLVAKACNQGLVTEDSCRVAAASELLHNATLLHDDVADQSDTRRGVPTINSLMGPSVSVLVGDYWLVAAMREILDCRQNSAVMIRIFAKTLSDLAKGEMLQLQKAASGDTSEDDYLKIIYYKTASLFEAAAVSASMSVSAPEDVGRAVRTYSVNLGMAFQIKDDILDYSGGSEVGKPLGVDVLEQKITLPLLGALSRCPSAEASDIRRKVADIAGHPEYRDEIVSFVNRWDGIGYASAELNGFISEAIRAIDNLPDSQSRAYLKNLAFFVAQRNV